MVRSHFISCDHIKSLTPSIKESRVFQRTIFDVATARRVDMNDSSINKYIEPINLGIIKANSELLPEGSLSTHLSKIPPDHTLMDMNYAKLILPLSTCLNPRPTRVTHSLCPSAPGLN